MNLKFVVEEDGNIKAKMVNSSIESDFLYKDFVVRLYKGEGLSDTQYDEKIPEGDRQKIDKLIEELREIVSPPTEVVE